MEFIQWHYTRGLDFYLKRYFYTLASIYQFFSVKLLLIHLFSPWKRLLIDEQSPGLNFAKRFEVFSFNFVSRFMGAIARITLFVVSIFTLVFIAIAGALGFLLWLALPILSFSIYTLHTREPEQVSHALSKKLSQTSTPGRVLCDSVPGSFLLERLGISREEGYRLFETGKPFVPSVAPTTFSELVTSYTSSDPEIEKRLLAQSLTVDAIVQTARWWDRRRMNKVKVVAQPPITVPGIGRTLLFGYTPTLDKYVVDLGAPQSFGHHLIGREQVVKRIERVLSSQSSVVLHGKPGVGRKTVMLEFAKRAREGQLGHDLSYARVLEFDYTPIISGSTDITQKKVLLSQALLEASHAGNVILVIRDLHRITNSSVEGMDMTDLFERHMESRALKIIALEGSVEYERFLAPNARLRTFFEAVEVVAMPKEEALTVLMDGAREWEKKLKITITIQAINEILDGAEDYITDTPFPEKAIEILDAVVVYAQEQGVTTILSEHVRAVLSEKTGISLIRLEQGEKDTLGELEKLLHTRLVGQDAAVSLISKILRAKTSGVVHTKRPIGSFLFLGPTGVGKTETAKVLSKVYFGSEQSILRFNMAEYTGDEGLSRLIGSLTRNTPGELTAAIKNRPASLLLLDEIEKAPREITNLFLSLLDEGVITDAFGNAISCSHLFVIGTSNAGAQTVRMMVQNEVSPEQMSKELVEAVISEKIFSPEFINRFDGVVVYTPLSKTELTEVAHHLLGELIQNLVTKNIVVSFSPEAVEKIVTQGYDPTLGARPMRRVIELSIGDLLGRAILSGEVKSGDKITIKPDGGKNGYVWEH